MAEEKFFRRGKTQLRSLPVIASPTKAPTVAEWTAGADLGDLLNDVTGFTFENQPIDTPKMSASFTGKIPGEDTADASVLTFYLQKTTNPLRTTLAKDSSQFIGIVDYKIGTVAAADKVDVWPSVVASTPKQYDMGNAPALWECRLTHGDTPALDIAVLA